MKKTLLWVFWWNADMFMSRCHGAKCKQALRWTWFWCQSILLPGKVYKGILSNGQQVAVKHIINDEHMETFIREVTSVSHVRHPNLVALLGCCENEDECFLVYELCHNGNLSDWLFGTSPNSINKTFFPLSVSIHIMANHSNWWTTGKAKVLSWMQRIEIAIGCARGLWFLHTYPEGCIVHRDIKVGLSDLNLCDTPTSSFHLNLHSFPLIFKSYVVLAAIKHSHQC